MKKTVTVLYIVVIAVMAVATMIEKKQGTSYVSDHIYGAWWFSALWALLTGFAIFYFIKRKVRRPSVVALHLSFVVILAGALLTHLTAERGIVLLRKGQVATHYLTPDLQEHQLPFTISLQAFEILYHEGTQAPADYISHVLIDQQPFTISMNQIANHKGIRLYQNNYDEDMQGSVLSLNSDPWGIPVTYSGYALLFISLIWMLIDPRGAYRQLLRRLSILVLLCSACGMANATPRTLPAETADRFGQLFVVYNERVCPMQTYALDFTKKLYGKRHYQDFTAEQVLTGFIFFYDDWIQEPLKQDTKPMKMEEKRMLIQQLHQGTPLKLFPYADQGKITWYAPTSTLPDTMDEEHQKYIRDVFTLLNGEIQAGRYDLANAYLDKMLQYQQTFGQQSLPTPLQVRAERLYNSHPLTAILLGIPLRWIITGHFPLSNGYETMLVLGWLVALLSILLYRRSRFLAALGILQAIIFLLVSHISQMDPQMTHLMPVLNSPLLTLHVSVIMMAYALLSLTFISSLTALFMPRKRQEIHLLSQLMLFPALTFLGIGIFIGAIWANISWGTYWSWDPKETWALITFMIYAVPAHRTFSPLNPHSSPLLYHLYMTLAFLAILMTYFGVNYLLGGMHAYA
jgi:ABC-type transport system involved in cytochrome c biogenesis permease subunit